MLLEPGGPISVIRELPDIMSASEGEGGHGKADVARMIAPNYISDPNADMGEGGKKIRK